VAYEVARKLEAPLDVLAVRKIGAPGQPELALGAVCEDGAPLLNRHLIRVLGVASDELGAAIGQARAELTTCVQRYRSGRPLPDLTDRTVIVVDDGLATGATAGAAVRYVRTQGARHVVVAVPVAATESVQRLAREVDEVVCVHASPTLRSVGEWYDDFSQTTDEEVADLLGSKRTPESAP